MNLAEFLTKTETLGDFEDHFPSATGVRPTPWGPMPVYSDAESWEQDFADTISGPNVEPTTCYGRHVRQSIDEVQVLRFSDVRPKP